MNQIILNHINLIIAWVVFSLLHSLLASQSVKTKVLFALNDKYKFYRVIYSLFALISLSIILAYNFSMQSILLWQVFILEKTFAIIILILSTAAMLMFTRRFFFDLSGADVFKKKQTSRQLIETGFYKHVRHPLYSVTILFAWSIFLWQPLLSNLITCICITAYTFIGIIIEERKLVKEFGENYITYKATTPMLIPKLLNKAVN